MLNSSRTCVTVMIENNRRRICLKMVSLLLNSTFNLLNFGDGDKGKKSPMVGIEDRDKGLVGGQGVLPTPALPR